MLGKTLDDKYRIERLLGSGGMGSVYAADDLRTGQKVAIKVIHANLHDSAALVQRFEREARAAGSIDTEHIARCYRRRDGPRDGQPVHGARIPRRGGPAPPHQAPRPPPAGAGAAHHRAGVPGRVQGARGQHRPPRHQAGQHLPRQGGRRRGDRRPHGEGAGLRRRQDPPRPQRHRRREHLRRAHPHGVAPGLAALHVAGAGPLGEEHRPPRGHLVARGGALPGRRRPHPL